MKKSFITLEKAREIREQYPTPFHVYDQKGIEDNAEELFRLCMEQGISGVFCR